MSHTFTITVSDVEYKAFTLVVLDPDAWVDHAASNKIRKAAIRIAEAHSADPTKWLTAADRKAIKEVMEANGDTMKPPKSWSLATLAEIVNRTSMPTRVEQDAASAAHVDPEPP